MLLTCKLFRPGGSRVTLGKGKEAREYHFKPLDSKADVDDPRVDHVCDVNDKDDIGTLLAIKEGYEVHGPEVVGKVKAAGGQTSLPPPPPPAPPAPQAHSADQGQKHYASMGKPDLLKLVAERTGSKPAPTTPRQKLIDRLETLDKHST